MAIAAQHVRDTPPTPQSALNPQLPPAVDRFMNGPWPRPAGPLRGRRSMRRALRELGPPLPADLGAAQPIVPRMPLPWRTPTPRPFPPWEPRSPPEPSRRRGAAEDTEPTPVPAARALQAGRRRQCPTFPERRHGRRWLGRRPGRRPAALPAGGRDGAGRAVVARPAGGAGGP
ncbi:hypothetical protein QJS66_11700 [Kocuria rhizophila]|nr:hypothetical protein QJS66_11700 [Kocuria rhizophila]